MLLIRSLGPTTNLDASRTVDPRVVVVVVVVVVVFLSFCVCVCVLYFYAFAFSWALLSSCISQIRRLTTQKEGPQRDTEEKKQTKEMDGDVDGGVVNIRFPDARTSIGRISFFLPSFSAESRGFFL